MGIFAKLNNHYLKVFVFDKPFIAYWYQKLTINKAPVPERNLYSRTNFTNLLKYASV
jgi:hypothetical protein